MSDTNVTEITIEKAQQLLSGYHIDNNLLLVDDMRPLSLSQVPRRSRCILLGLCLDGTVQYSIDTITHTVQKNELIIISEGQLITDCVFSNDFKSVAILLSYSFFSEIISDIHELSALFLFARNHPVCHLSNDEVWIITDYIKLLRQKIEDKGHHFRKETARSLIATMIYDLSNVIYRMQTQDTKRQVRAEKIFTDFIHLIEQNFKYERRVSWYAQQLCITPKYLTETVKAVSKRTPNDWINNYVVTELRVQLRNSTKSIKEITQEMHFANQSFLGKYFKDHVGMSPTKYRKL